MLYILFSVGQRLQKHYKIWSGAGIAAILAYTLNEGLRFGRGLDYNMGGMAYERFAYYGGDFDNYIGYAYLVKALVKFNVPWQGCVMIMSCLFIVGLLFLMRSQKEVVSFALPLFVLVSSVTVENLFKWYMAFSFFMIGLSYQMENLNTLNKKYVFFSCFSILFHYAFLPVPFVFYFLIKFDRPILTPIWSILLFFAIVFFFETSFMLHFADLINNASMLSDRFAGYADNMEEAFTKGFRGRETSPLPGVGELLFLICIVIFGYKCVKLMDQKYVYIYNLFLLGFLLKPITNQIPLLARYDHVLFFFRAVVFACVLQKIYKERKKIFNPNIVAVASLIFFLWLSAFVKKPLTDIPERYLYVWNQGNLTYINMINIITERADNKSEELKKNKDKNLFNL